MITQLRTSGALCLKETADSVLGYEGKKQPDWYSESADTQPITLGFFCCGSKPGFFASLKVRLAKARTLANFV